MFLDPFLELGFCEFCDDGGADALDEGRNITFSLRSAGFDSFSSKNVNKKIPLQKIGQGFVNRSLESILGLRPNNYAFNILISRILTSQMRYRREK